MDQDDEQILSSNISESKTSTKKEGKSPRSRFEERSGMGKNSDDEEDDDDDDGSDVSDSECIIRQEDMIVSLS